MESYTPNTAPVFTLSAPDMPATQITREWLVNAERAIHESMHSRVRAVQTSIEETAAWFDEDLVPSNPDNALTLESFNQAVSRLRRNE